MDFVYSQPLRGGTTPRTDPRGIEHCRREDIGASCNRWLARLEVANLSEKPDRHQEFTREANHLTHLHAQDSHRDTRGRPARGRRIADPSDMLPPRHRVQRLMEEKGN